MKVNIVEGLGIHLECLGFLLESFKDHDITLYLKFDKFMLCDFLCKIIKKFNIVYFTDLKLDDADLTIKLTSNDYCIDREDILSILHVNTNKTKSKKYISLTPYVFGDNITYLFPCYTIHTHLSFFSNTICYIGFFIQEQMDDDLIYFIKNSKFSFTFIVWGDSNYNYLSSYSNVQVLTNVSTEVLSSYLEKSKYILSKKSPYQRDDRFSGVLSLAVSFKKPLILQEKYRQVYNIPSIHSKQNTQR
jgi:hypothetical protein